MGHWLEEEKRQAPLPEAEAQGCHALLLCARHTRVTWADRTFLWFLCIYCAFIIYIIFNTI